MVERNYHAHNNFEPLPALYIELTRPTDNMPFKKDLLAPLDTGAPLTVIPLKYRDSANLQPHDYTPIRHGTYYDPRCPKYLVKVTAEGCAQQMVEIIFLHTTEKPLIGRNLMKFWETKLRGPECMLEVSEP
jgi:predicted aspartyl protease